MELLCVKLKRLSSISNVGDVGTRLFNFADQCLIPKSKLTLQGMTIICRRWIKLIRGSSEDLRSIMVSIRKIFAKEIENCCFCAPNFCAKNITMRNHSQTSFHEFHAKLRYSAFASFCFCAVLRNIFSLKGWLKV